MKHARLVPAALLALTLISAGCSKDPTGPDSSDVVDLFPVPVSDATSLFPEVDDAYLAVPFTLGFDFPFYGATYDTVYLNTNGGLTFGYGESEYDVAAADVSYPGIAVFWGDMDAAAFGADTLANQMTCRQFSDRFEVTYTQFQDNDAEIRYNTATLTLYDDGRIVIEYGTVLSPDILIGVWDGTHTADFHADSTTYVFWDYTLLGTGVILHDYWNEDPAYDGRYDGRTISFAPPLP